ncbi:hypothetical protein [Bradyrhizobium sp. McL0615]|uniref:hypothetical protein n=1 Tax=Bradyrhizobium sp. McL0615 TaxID=3415673 RepID=UPI003CFB298D
MRPVTPVTPARALSSRHDGASGNHDLDRSSRAVRHRDRFAGLTAHLAGPLLATAFAIDELIPTAVVFFAVAAGLGWIGNRFWPEEWMYNPLL